LISEENVDTPLTIIPESKFTSFVKVVIPNTFKLSIEADSICAVVAPIDPVTVEFNTFRLFAVNIPDILADTAFKSLIVEAPIKVVNPVYTTFPLNFTLLPKVAIPVIFNEEDCIDWDDKLVEEIKGDDKDWI
jgi:hypothetical protein